MTLNLETLAPAVQSQKLSSLLESERHKHHGSQTGQGRWLLEMEKAMLTASKKKSSSANEEEPPQEAKRAGNESEQAMFAQQTLGNSAIKPADLAADSTPSEMDTSSSPLLAQGAGSSERTMSTNGSTDSRSSSSLSAASSAHDAIAAAAQIYGAYGAAGAAGAGQSGSGIGGNSQLAASASNGSLSERNYSSIAQVGATVLNKMLDTASFVHNTFQLQASSVSHLGFHGFASQNASEKSPENKENMPFNKDLAREQGRSASDNASAQKPYEKQALHVFHADDGVHAWVRDMQLQPTQMMALAKNMVSEFAATKNHLMSLTVNGKKLIDRALTIDNDLLGKEEFVSAAEYATPLEHKLSLPAELGVQIKEKK